MRKYYIDNIRSATAGVIGPFYKIQYQDALQYLLYPWFMMILFIISGVSSRYYLENIQ